MIHEERYKPVSAQRKSVKPQIMKTRMSKIVDDVDCIELIGGIQKKIIKKKVASEIANHQKGSRKSIMNPGSSFQKVIEREESSDSSDNWLIRK